MVKFISTTLLALVASVCAHGSHNEIKTKPEGLSWQKWHMLEEHQLEQYDATTFFKLHDLANTGEWGSREILNLYGLMRETIVGDGSGMGTHDHGQEVITQDAKDIVVATILELIDENKDGKVSLEEYRNFIERGGDLPDFNYGQGHHLDFEAEYEEHHWNKYHKDQDPDVEIKHKEDIEHELLHHEHEIEESHNNAPQIREVTKNYLSNINLENVPSKYRRNK
ncbi:hypothetical protein CAAN1_01S08218 [[Candida] anglica]|uniref:EF-hand domain-containing protein n=1 Tax=[Candida] anglica TaxID=148631 RepID=A0ABP0EJZ2_9ASCO